MTAEHTPHHVKNSSQNVNTLHVVLGVVVVALALFNVWQLYSTSSVTKPVELEKPDIEYALLVPKDCPLCYDLKAVTSKIETMNLEVKEKVDVDPSSSAGKALIKKYALERLPAIIIKGEVRDSSQLLSFLNDVGTEREGAFIVTALNPPFVDTASGDVKGLMTITLLAKDDCKDCFDIEPLLGLLQEQLSVKEIKKIAYNSPEGKALLATYNISKLPTVIFDEEASYHPSITEVWENVGSVEEDGSYVMRNLNPPYFDLVQGKVKGLVTLILLKDKTCAECYDASAVNKPILRRLGLAFTEKDKELDVTLLEAQGLIAKYKITKIPTILLLGDTDVYPALPEIWKDVGTVEYDGTYVFRKVELFQLPYKDLEQKKVIKPVTSANTSTSP